MPLKEKCSIVGHKVFFNLFPEAQKSSNHANPCLRAQPKKPILSQKNNISIVLFQHKQNFLNHKWKNKFDCQTQCVLKILSVAFSATVPISSTRTLTYRHMKYFWQFSECCLLNNYFIKAYTRDLHQSNQVEMPCVA